MNEQLPVNIKVTRQNGEWIISIVAPKWFIEELDNVDVTIQRASSTYPSYGDAASIDYAVKHPPAASVPGKA